MFEHWISGTKLLFRFFKAYCMKRLPSSSAHTGSVHKHKPLLKHTLLLITWLEQQCGLTGFVLWGELVRQSQENQEKPSWFQAGPGNAREGLLIHFLPNKTAGEPLIYTKAHLWLVTAVNAILFLQQRHYLSQRIRAMRWIANLFSSPNYNLRCVAFLGNSLRRQSFGYRGRSRDLMGLRLSKNG